MMSIFFSVLVGLTSFFASAEDRGWCYSSLQKSTMTEPQLDIPPKKLTDRAIEERHWLAMKASMLAYELPDLENTPNGNEFVDNFVDFVEHKVPNQIPGYHYWDSYSNRKSGLKFVILAPDNSSNPWLFAFAGSETAIDWLADLNMGRDQINHMESMVKRMMDCLNIDNAGEPIAGKNWIITGHSLGGGLAQIFAYKVQSLRTLMRLTPNRIELVTFNGFGALELALPDALAAEIIIPQMLTSNYFVEGDIVSRIGQHIGQTIEIPTGDTDFNPLQAATSHLMTTVEELLVKDNFFSLNKTRKTAPPFSKSLNNLKVVGRTLGFLTFNHSDRVVAQLQHINILHQAVKKLKSRSINNPVDHKLKNYLSELTSDYKTNLLAEVQTSFRDQLIGDLENILAKIENLQ